MPGPPRVRRWWALVSPPQLGVAGLVVVLIVLLAVHASHFSFLCDDAYISFRYARNLAEGHGLVFNRGERVEGYTNFLWVLEIASLWRGFGISPERGALALSWCFTGATVAVTVAMAAATHHRTARPATVAVTLLFLATNRSFAVWTTSGLETRQFTFLVLAAVYALWHHRAAPNRLWIASILFAAAELTRPEALLLWGCAATWLGLDQWRRGELRWSRECLAPLVRFALPFCTVVALHFIARYAYYGEWLPNTYYAKHVRPWMDAGARYLLTAGLEHGLVGVLALAGLGTWSSWRLARDPRHLLGILCIFVHALYLARIGGDHFEYRPLDFYWPLLYVALADGVVHLYRSLPWSKLSRAAVTTSATAMVLLYGLALPWLDHLATRELHTRAETFELHPTLDPERAPELAWLPLISTIAQTYNDARSYCAPHYIGARWLEHKVFHRTQHEGFAPYAAADVRDQIPAGLTSAMATVGVAPFFMPEVTVIDTRGLTDSTVARNPVARPNEARKIAHDRRPPSGYLEDRGVNVRILPAASSQAMALSRAPWAVQLSPTVWMPFRSDTPHTLFPDHRLVGHRPTAVAPRAGLIIDLGGHAYEIGTILWDGDGPPPSGWVREGQAFAHQPVAGAQGRQREVEGFLGRSLINSYDARSGDKATGSLRSPRFRVEAGDVLGFFIGGGEGRGVGVSVHTDTGELGRVSGKNRERLRFVTIDLDPAASREVWIEVIDRESGSWGHTLVDHFVLLCPAATCHRARPATGPRPGSAP